MYCQKCGTQNEGNASFCIKCGKNLAGETEVKKPKKKKSKRLLIALSLIVLIIVAIALSSGDTLDYVATVQAHKPFEGNGSSITYSELFSKYIDSPKWEFHTSGDVGFVDISGKLKDDTREIRITIKISPTEDPNHFKIIPHSVSLGGNTSPSSEDAIEFITFMFDAYKKGYGSFADYLDNLG